MKLLAPFHAAGLRIKAPDGAVEGGEMKFAFGHHWRGDDVVIEPGFPQRQAFPEREGAEPMFAALWIGHENASVHHGGLGEQRIAEPFFPSDLSAGGLDDFEGAALGVEHRKALGEHGGRGAVVPGVQTPGECAVAGVEGVKVVAAKAATHKEAVAAHCRGGHGAPWFDDDPPASEAGGVVLESDRAARRT